MKQSDSGWLSWAVGIVGGIALWKMFKPKLVPTSLPATVHNLPPTASPARFADLGSVSLRIDQVWKMFQNGTMSAEQALSEAEGLAAAANSFSLARGEDASVIYAQALALQDSIQRVLDSRRMTS
jgi:hypothetical protein